MGGKGQRRREKNYRAAHGGETRLPPPPSLKELDVFPFKLRKIMELRNENFFAVKQGHTSTSKGSGGQKRKPVSDCVSEKNKKLYKNESSSTTSSVNKEGIPAIKEDHLNSNDAIKTQFLNGEEKEKRKRKVPKDLRFVDMDQVAGVSRKKKRKDYLEAKKKKNKRPKIDDVRDFPGREEIVFGEVVQAPPKLSVPKRSTKGPLDAFHERVRLETIEAYRKKRGWESRPGVHIPMPENPST
ncbi:uncharacterized protein LOC122002941 [Zingiber officinale]|uniref:Uncharacterized protein n=1 Tax=Zingiber officinale TaxID=94328 RepID=A0A8J5FV56_ZINOF|nr:uncharacterized protein LOC122002941 [Zingiber officinale]KAG6494409.1 hypothetical protein ZIOFF_049434 [Zingiber officinale]